MNRREFLKVSGITTGLLLLLVSPKAGKLMNARSQGEAAGKLYRGTLDGKIYKSEDMGRSWDLHTNFGDQYAILGFSAKRDGQIVAHLSYQFRDFELLLAKNEKSWMLAA